MRPTYALLLALGLGLGLAACATGSGPGSPGHPYNVEGAYEGSFVFDGSPFEATVRLRTRSGGRVTGAFRVGAPVEIDGPVQGAVRDELLRLTVRYTNPGGCDGRIEGILTIERGGGEITGPVTVTDCGTPVAGRVRLVRRPLGPGGA
ncbi:MAG: hypothetical protein OEN56_03290 [Gemmatimonadota bacterium]|nr:hypothetical protein [Gemmatimonadota bacterium]MDH3424863.1 hypothetical protein [Gemmatimonadota bacterium]